MRLPCLTDVNNFYLTEWILGRNFPRPEVVGKTMLSIVENQKRINELLHFLNPNNAGLESAFGGLTWAMLQYCIGFDEKKDILL